MESLSIRRFLMIFTLVAVILAAGPAESRNSWFSWQKSENSSEKMVEKPAKATPLYVPSRTWKEYFSKWGKKESEKAPIFTSAKGPKMPSISDYDPHSPDQITEYASAQRAPHMEALAKVRAETRHRLAMLDQEQRMGAIERQAMDRQEFEKMKEGIEAGAAEEKPAKKVIYNKPGALTKPAKVFTDYR